MTEENDGTFLFALVIVAVLALISSSVRSEEVARSQMLCMTEGDDCGARIIRLPDGLEGQVLKFEACKEGECDREHREHWVTQHLVPPPGEVCHNTDVNEALSWIEQNRPGWLLAGWGCGLEHAGRSPL
jgi:hypothetical protein